MLDNKLKASTSYGDLRGTCSIDFHGGPAGDETKAQTLSHFAKQNGIDTAKYFAIGFGVYKEPESDFEAVVLYAVDTSVVGGTYDTIMEYVQQHPGPLPVLRFELDRSFSDCLSTMKRFSVVAAIDELSEKEISVQG